MISKEISDYMRMIGAKGNKNRPREFYVKMAKLSAKKRRKKLSPPEFDIKPTASTIKSLSSSKIKT